MLGHDDSGNAFCKREGDFEDITDRRDGVQHTPIVCGDAKHTESQDSRKKKDTLFRLFWGSH